MSSWKIAAPLLRRLRLDADLHQKVLGRPMQLIAQWLEQHEARESAA